LKTKAPWSRSWCWLRLGIRQYFAPLTYHGSALTPIDMEHLEALTK